MMQPPVPPRLALLLVLVSSSLACGGTDDGGNSSVDEGEAGPDGSDPGESSESASSSTTTADTDTDGSSDSSSESPEGSSSADDLDDAMEDPPVEESPDTHDSIEGAETIVDDGSDCANSCECPQGLLCTDFGICAPAPDDVWCCTNPGCPVGEACVFPDESEGVCR